ncbi:MAG: hypothetical protein ACK2T3_08665, partial [Candidatus Promineifilaceae bacterium]
TDDLSDPNRALFQAELRPGLEQISPTCHVKRDSTGKYTDRPLASQTTLPQVNQASFVILQRYRLDIN